jgi:hypothetical protein
VLEDIDVSKYLMRGYWIFRRIIPASLLRDLRCQADIARSLAHEINGPQAQRIQPLEKFSDKLDFQPFKDYAELADLREAIESLLGPGYTHAHLNIMGLLVEPLEHPWCCGWHRDGVVEVPIRDRNPAMNAAMKEFWHDLRVFNQVNCALYADYSTWFVPGSHLRTFDEPGEIESTGRSDMQVPPGSMSSAEAERYYLDHCLSMPNAEPIHLFAGDFMIYRNLAWHTGLYLPYQPRATIHDIISHPDSSIITAKWRKLQEVVRSSAK